MNTHEAIQPHAGPFNPPDEFMPPWVPDGLITGQFRDRQRRIPLTLATHDMMPHRTCYNIHNWENRHMTRIAGLLLKDTLCSTCWDFRSIPTFYRRLQVLMRPLYCTGCRRYHARALFSQAAVDNSNYRHRLCIGWTGRVRICDHQAMTWQEYTQTPRKFDYSCKPCKMYLTSESVDTFITLLKAKYTRKHRGIEGQLTTIRKCLEKKSEHMACPHYQLNDPTIRTYLFHTIRQVCPNLDARTQRTSVVKPLLDCWGKPWGCPKAVRFTLAGPDRAIPGESPGRRPGRDLMRRRRVRDVGAAQEGGSAVLAAGHRRPGARASRRPLGDDARRAGALALVRVLVVLARGGVRFAGGR